MIPFKKINLGNSYELVKPLFESGMIGYGEKTRQFEKEFASYIGAKYVLAVNSCTTALYLSLLYEKAYEGLQEVSIPSMTQALVPNAVLQARVGLTFNDNIEWVGDRYLLEGSHVIDTAHRTRRNDFSGLPDKTKLCYSFYPTKVIGSIDGGAIATNDSKFFEWVSSYAFYGRNQKANLKNSWEYEIQQLGGKYNYNDVQAVICLEQLQRLDETNEKRRKVRESYNRQLNITNTSDYLYRIHIQNRDQFIKFALEAGIECGVHFQPLHTMTPFKPFEFKGDSEKVAFEYEHTVSLPFYEDLTEEEIKYISDFVMRWEFFGEQGV